MNALTGTLIYELRIGVTGHRNLAPDKVSQIEAAVDGLLRRIGETLSDATAHPFGQHGSPRTGVQRFDRLLVRALQALGLINKSPTTIPVERQTPVNWVVVSPLAKGADRIVARAVLERLPQSVRKHSTDPPRLEVILPLPLEEYRQDFAEEDDLREFQELFSVAQGTDSVMTLNANFLSTTHADPHAARNAAYEDVGRAIVEACEILIAIWNGKPAAGRGGTAEIIRYAVDAGRFVLWISSEDPSAPVQVLKRQPHSADGSQDDYSSEPLPTRAKLISLGFHRLSAYQRDPLHRRVEPRMPGWIAQRRELAKDEPAVTKALQTIDAALSPHYVRTDALASMYQILYRRAANTVYACSAAAVAVVAAQLLFFPRHSWLLAFEIALMVIAGVLVRVSRVEQWKEKWQHDRHLAEWLRRQHFTWLLHGDLQEMQGQVIDPSPYWGAEEWFEQAFQPVLARLRRERRDPLPLAMLQLIVVQGWIESQATWHEKQIHRHEHAAQATHRWGWLLFAGTLIAAVLHIAGVGHGDGHELHAAPSLLVQAISFFAIVLPAVAAAIHACAVLRDHERLAARSMQMAPVLRGLADRGLVASNHQELARVVAEADHVMAQESDDWWISLSGQPPVMPG